jgi:hypothetical protein
MTSLYLNRQQSSNLEGWDGCDKNSLDLKNLIKSKTPNNIAEEDIEKIKHKFSGKLCQDTNSLNYLDYVTLDFKIFPKGESNRSVFRRLIGHKTNTITSFSNDNFGENHYLYIIDTNNILYYYSDPFDEDNEPKYYKCGTLLAVRNGLLGEDKLSEQLINHPCLNEGNSILAAGELIVEGNILKSVNNRSGHYLPGPESLKITRDVLKSLNYDITKITFQESMPSSGQKNKMLGGNATSKNKYRKRRIKKERSKKKDRKIKTRKKSIN